MTLEPVVIDGKRGTVAYFNAAGEMTTADKAVTAKVVFEDGSHLWLVLQGSPRPGRV